MVRAHGRIDRLLPVHGFVITEGGAEILFHRNCVVDGGYDRLQVGDAVDLVMTEEGPAARAQAVIPAAVRASSASW